MATEVVDLLAEMALFADLSPAQLQGVAHTFEEDAFQEGRRILRRGLQGGNFYLILDGEAIVAVDGQELARLKRGDFFGELSILLGEPPTADVTVASASLRCLVLPGEELEPFLLAHPTVALRLLRSQARRMRSAIQWRN